jgi:glutamate decarboxylase
MLDGNARLQLGHVRDHVDGAAGAAADAECFDKNMIDKDEYPQTAELEAALRQHPQRGSGTHRTRPRRPGCSTTGVERGGDARRLGAQAPLAAAPRGRGQAGRQAEPRDGQQRPVCWEKLANYWDVEMRLVPMEGDRFTLSPEEAVSAMRREHDRRQSRSSGSTFDGAYEADRRDLQALDAFQARPGSTCPCTWTALRARSSRPFVDPDLEWDFASRGRARSTPPGHKYGLVVPRRRLGRLARQRRAPDGLIFWVNYLGDNMPTFALNFSRPGAQVVAQYYNFLPARLRRLPEVQGYARDVATRLSSRIEELGPFELLTRGDELPVYAFTAAGRRRELHRLRRFERAPRAGLAGTCVHLPEEP